jgi:hypothetical protein
MLDCRLLYTAVVVAIPWVLGPLILSIYEPRYPVSYFFALISTIFFFQNRLVWLCELQFLQFIFLDLFYFRDILSPILENG